VNNRTLVAETPSHIGQEVTLQGWIHVRRDMGKIIFVHLRDRTGQVQVVFVPGECPDYEKAKELRDEFVVEISGVVAERGKKNINPNMVTGTVEIQARSLTILNTAATPPFPLENTMPVSEDIRLKYRYLDLRSDRMQKNIRFRHKVIQFMRNWLDKEGFVEVETPHLTKGTPEGAREFIVPSRIHDGEFYVLPQSPQQFKQLLMVAGFERYYQIARCFRDEDQRGDRQPEFTQLDMEMSFVAQEDVLELNERLFTELVKELPLSQTKKLSQHPFPRLTYKEAMEKYGTDKPDLRQDKNDPNELAFAWIVDFPMFEKDKDGKIQSVHHPFCMPHPDDIPMLDTDPLKVRAWSYDLVLNGYEISSGSIRIHQAELQKKMFTLMGLSEEEIQAKFGHMLEAFTFGAPPHGGMAPGVDRLIMILMDEPNIREVIAFPKTGDAQDLMMGAPSPLSPAALRDAHIELRKKTSS